MAVAKKKTTGKKLKSAVKTVARKVKKAVKAGARMIGANGRKKTTKSKSTAKRTRK